MFIELPEVGWLVGFVIALSLSSMYCLKAEWLVAKVKLAIFSLTCF